MLESARKFAGREIEKKFLFLKCLEQLIHSASVRSSEQTAHRLFVALLTRRH